MIIVKKSSISIICLAMLFSFLILMPQAKAETNRITAVEGAKFDLSGSLKDNLKAYIGKNILIHLRSGKTLQGYVKAVGNDLIHLEKLAGRDFYDALVRIEDISAMEAKFRDMK